MRLFELTLAISNKIKFTNSINKLQSSETEYTFWFRNFDLKIMFIKIKEQEQIARVDDDIIQSLISAFGHVIL